MHRSATHGCDAMMGLPHSLREHALSGKACGLASNVFDASCISEITFAPRSPAPTDAEINAMSE